MTKKELEEIHVLELVNKIRKIWLLKGYTFFDRGDFNLNIIPIRNLDNGKDALFDNEFSDLLLVLYKEKGVWQKLVIEWTTLAGTLGFGGEQNPLTGAQTGTGVDGVAVILEGQYLGSLEYVSNGWRYPFVKYLKQIKPFRYVRDNNKNYKLDLNTQIFYAIYSTHLHPMSPTGILSRFVNYWGSAWSQGCMGSPEPIFKKLSGLFEKAIANGQSKIFSFTLINSNDFKIS